MKRNGEVVSIERGHNTWFNYTADVLVYNFYGNYYKTLNYCGYSRREVIQKLREEGYSVSHNLY